MPSITESKLISGVYIVELQPFADERGRFMETFRKEWFPQRSWDCIQSNRSDSHAGVLRGLHYHHHQVDYWYTVRGALRAAIVDLRPSSPSYLASQTVEMGDDNEIGLFIPSGVAHGFVALTDVTLTYVVDSYYDGGRDEYGVAWNDPDLGLDWGVTPAAISERDAGNPRLRAIPPELLPQ